MKASLTFLGEYLVLRDVTDLMQGVKRDMAVYAHVDIQDVIIMDVHPGSVVLDVVVQLPSDRSDQDIEQLKRAIMKRPQDIFSEDFIDNFGVPTVDETPQSKPGLCLMQCTVYITFSSKPDTGLSGIL